MALPTPDAAPPAPLILLVPGRDAPASDWMRRWGRDRADCHCLELGMWDMPHRNTWVNKINLAVHRADRPVVLIADDIACLAVAWWAEYEKPSFAEPVIGAILVSPPDVDRPGSDPRLARFGCCPREHLPFPTYLVPDPDVPAERHVTACRLARDWGAAFAAAGSERGNEPFAPRLLAQLTREYRQAARLAGQAGSALAAPAKPRAWRGSGAA